MRVDCGRLDRGFRGCIDGKGRWLLGSTHMFFCRQKTAYDMRISDWSSDVCSSDLLVMGKQSAKLGHQMMRIAVVDIRETRPESSREFQAEEAAGKFQHAVRLFKRLLDMGDVPYAKGDCISVELPVRQTQAFGVFLGPDTTFQTAFLRPPHADAQHFRVDIRHGQRKSTRLNSSH